jgi:uncharacterized protein (TIGR00369 family)
MATNADPNTKKTGNEEGPDTPAENSGTPAGSTRNYCFACGRDNPEGLGLMFTFDEERKSYVCHFRLSRRHTGPPGYAHGGIIATILDEAMGKANRISKVTAVTQSMTVEYLRLVPLDKPLVAEGRQRSIKGRVHVNVAELRSVEGEILARSEGTFIAIDPQKTFG